MAILSLFGGIAGFIVAIFFGHNFGWDYCSRRNKLNRQGLMRGFAHYPADFFLNLFFGFVVQTAAWRVADLIGFLPEWLKLLILTLLIGAVFGFLYGFRLGYVRVYKGSNYKVSKAPSIIGALIGMIACVIYLY